MNFGYGDIIDYLMSSHRDSLEVAMELDMRYIIEKSFKGTTPAERAMMVLDFVLNYSGPAEASVVKAVTHYAGDDVLEASVCGIPIIDIALSRGSSSAMGIFEGYEKLPMNLDDDKVSRIDGIVGLFKADLRNKKSPNKSMDLLLKGRDFLSRECFGEKENDGSSKTPII